MNSDWQKYRIIGLSDVIAGGQKRLAKDVAIEVKLGEYFERRASWGERLHSVCLLEGLVWMICLVLFVNMQKLQTNSEPDS